MAKTDVTRIETLKWNGSMQDMKLRVVQMDVPNLGRILCWDVWGGDGVALATGSVPAAKTADGTDDEAAMIKHGARIAKATARAIVLTEVRS